MFTSPFPITHLLLKVVTALENVVSELKQTQGLLNSPTVSSFENSLFMLPDGLTAGSNMTKQISTLKSSMASIQSKLVTMQSSIIRSITRYGIFYKIYIIQDQKHNQVRYILQKKDLFKCTFIEVAPEVNHENIFIRLKREVLDWIGNFESEYESTSLKYWNIAVQVLLSGR